MRRGELGTVAQYILADAEDYFPLPRRSLRWTERLFGYLRRVDDSDSLYDVMAAGVNVRVFHVEGDPPCTLTGDFRVERFRTLDEVRTHYVENFGCIAVLSSRVGINDGSNRSIVGQDGH